MTSTAARIRLCTVDELPLGLGQAFDVIGTRIAVFRTRSERIFAVDAICPHKGAPLADGMLAGDQVVCPYHTFKFDSRTGECDQPGVCSIATYPVEVTNGTVYVNL